MAMHIGDLRNTHSLRSNRSL